MRSGGQVAMVKEEDLVFDVVVNVMKGRDGYGIYFSSLGGVIKTTKLDKGSEAEIAGVQPGDELIFVQDNDKKYPAGDPGCIVPVSPENYQAALAMVRNMTNVRLGFKSPGF